MDELVSSKELDMAIKQFKNEKSPGSDGLTIEFFKTFWSKLKKPLLESINYSLQNQLLSKTQREGIITLIPKKDKPREKIQNWRPITLLNLDYKILSKILANRLKEVLPYLINEDQVGFIKGRYIGYNIRKLEECIEYLDNTKNSGIIINIDFEKAFDGLNWELIYTVLNCLNFGQKFINYIKTLYTNISAQIINNGHLSDPFFPKRGVRQGCPISPYLFILSVEILASSIRQN